MHCSAFSPWAVFKLCTSYIPNTENQNNQRNHFRAVLFSSWSYLSSPLHLNLSVTQAHGSAESKAVGSVCPQRVTHHQTHTIRFSVWARTAKTLVKKPALKSSCFLLVFSLSVLKNLLFLEICASLKCENCSYRWLSSHITSFPASERCDPLPAP